MGLNIQNELQHYGMPRRSGRYPWGSGDRPYQGEITKKVIRKAEKGRERNESFNKDHILKSGTIIHRSTQNKDEKDDSNPKYVTYLSPERNLYRGGGVANFNPEQKLYERTMVLKKDLNIASLDTIKEVSNRISKDPKILKESVKYYYDMIYPEDSVFRQEMTYVWKTGQSSKKLWNDFVDRSYEEVKNQPIHEGFSIMMASLGRNNSLKEKIISELKKEGYNAMQDLAGVKSRLTIEGIDPLIIFNPNDVLENIDIKEVSEKEIKKSGKEYDNWRRKATHNF